MKVIEITEKSNVSDKNGQTYLNYYVRVLVDKVAENGTKYQESYRHQIVGDGIQSLIKSGKIRSYKDLEGKNIELYRHVPAFLDKFERQKTIITKADTVVIM